MNILPFVITDAGYATAFDLGLGGVLQKVMTAVSVPLTVIVVLWIIVQGVLIMRGDVDPRKGTVTLLKHVIVIWLITSFTDYSYYVQQTFQTAIPQFIDGISGLSAQIPVPLQLDIMMGVLEIEFQVISSAITNMNGLDASALGDAHLVMFGSMWATFAVYEIAGIMTRILVTLGPIVLVGFLFEATKDIVTHWIGFLIGYALLTLLVNIVVTTVVGAEVIYATTVTGIIAAVGPTPSKILGLYNMDIFLLTGNLILLTLPAIAAQLGGNFGAGAGEVMGVIARGGSARGEPAGVGKTSSARPG